MDEQNEKFNKEIESIKKSQTNSGAEEYNKSTKIFNRNLQQQT